MQFRITRIDSENNTLWNIIPTSGAYADQVIATAEGVNMQHVTFEAKTMIGNIKAVWGMSVLMDDIYGDIDTIRGLHLGGRFDTKVESPLTLDYDGFFDTAMRVCRGASRILAIGNSIYGKGVK